MRLLKHYRIHFQRARNADLPNVDKLRASTLAAMDPVTVAEQFERDFKFLNKFFLMLEGSQGGEGVLGDILHYYVRKEYQVTDIVHAAQSGGHSSWFQGRGAPHLHIKLWVRGGPVLGVTPNAEVIAFIDKYITCRIPSATASPDLHNLVTTFQAHKCCVSFASVFETFFTRLCSSGA